MTMPLALKNVDAGVLRIGYWESGAPQGWPVVLLHGFPYDAHAYDAVVPILAAGGARVIVPYLRGFGPTTFLSADALRSGQQAALGADLKALLDSLEIERAFLAGFDWGGRAACVVSALWPNRVAGLVTQNGYAIQDIASAAAPAPPEAELRLWYQYYFHGERGRAGLAGSRRAFCRLLWTLWSPAWRFDEEAYQASAAAFDNPDFVDVAIHSYRHRFGLVGGDPAYEELEQRLASQPPIEVPAISLDGGTDGVRPPAPPEQHARHFTGFHEHRLIPWAGHNLPQEAPGEFAAAILCLRRQTTQKRS